MKIKLNIASILAISFLLISQIAHADFRKALDAYIDSDGATMLKEVKDAVDSKNDDGIILFLGILKEYPKTLRSFLNEAEQEKLFNFLESASSQSTLQSQYKLAVIPRTEDTLSPISIGTDKDRERWFEARKLARLKEHRQEVARLEPVANKGYAPAALELYANYAHYLTKSKSDQDNALLWLNRAAQLGDPQAAFLLGMKYLNVVDGLFGCTSRQKKQPDCQLPKDEIKGWHWMQEAAKHANKPNMMMTVLSEELSLQMGDLYMQGVAGNEPDYEQAYLWYRRMPIGLTLDTSLMGEKLEALRNIGQLKKLDPGLDKAWGHAVTWKEAVNFQEVIDALNNSNKLPELLEQRTTNNKSRPVFSMSTLRWFRPNFSYAGIMFDVYDDGRVKLLFGNSSFNESNDELLMSMKPHQIRKFIDEVQDLNLIENYFPGYCESGCLETMESSIFVKDKQISLKNTQYDRVSGLSNPDLKNVLGIIERNFPLIKLLCDADIGEGRHACYQIYKDILPPENVRYHLLKLVPILRNN